MTPIIGATLVEISAHWSLCTQVARGLRTSRSILWLRVARPLGRGAHGLRLSLDGLHLVDVQVHEHRSGLSAWWYGKPKDEKAEEEAEDSQTSIESKQSRTWKSEEQLVLP